MNEGGGEKTGEKKTKELRHRHLTEGFDETRLGMREVLPARFPMTVREYGWVVLDTEPDRTPILSGGFTRSAKSHRKSAMELLSGSCFDDDDELLAPSTPRPASTGRPPRTARKTPAHRARSAAGEKDRRTPRHARRGTTLLSACAATLLDSSSS